MPNATLPEKILLEKYAPLVRRVAYALQTMKPAMLDRDDVIQDGMIGLLRAIRGSRGSPNEAQFTAFANLNIRGAIIDGYRAAGEISRHDYDHAKKTRQAILDGKEVSPEERARAEMLFSMAWSPATQVGGVTEDTFQLTDPDPGPEQRAISNQLLRRAIDTLQECSVRDRSIFIACEMQGEKHEVVAERFELSSGRISQIIKQVRTRVLHSIA